ncbi:unnamed protein product [Dovyalis caffra]|uniref:Uncharacterized protein n=1 Tax=Dovyalis caffra TaxID=77055 RepID=A0AAV1SAH2_9ROSI|nr:unnamed protein product [Dovyalis caffra]
MNSVSSAIPVHFNSENVDPTTVQKMYYEDLRRESDELLNRKTSDDQDNKGYRA